MTTHSPMNIILGRDNYKLPRYKFNANNPKTYIDYFVKRQAIIHRDANEKQRIYDQLRQTSYNKNKSKEEYHVFRGFCGMLTPSTLATQKNLVQSG